MLAEDIYAAVFAVHVNVNPYGVGGIFNSVKHFARHIVGEVVSAHRGVVEVGTRNNDPVFVCRSSEHGLFFIELNFISFFLFVPGTVASALELRG